MADLEIFRRVEALREDMQTRFVSYGTGARAFEQQGIRSIDLGLPDSNPIPETTVLSGQVIAWLRPDVVVAHEEYPALPVAKIFQLPTLAITDWVQ